MQQIQPALLLYLVEGEDKLRLIRHLFNSMIYILLLTFGQAKVVLAIYQLGIFIYLAQTVN